MSEFTELMIAEPPLPPFAGMLRAHKGRVVTVHGDDSSRLLGVVEYVSEDGMLVDLLNGRDLYTVDVSKLWAVQTGKGAKITEQPDPSEQVSGR